MKRIYLLPFALFFALFQACGPMKNSPSVDIGRPDLPIANGEFQISWVSPTGSRLSAHEKISLRALIKTSKILTDRDFTIFLNEKPVTGSWSLTPGNPGEWMFQASVPLENGQNALFIELKKDGAQARTPRIFVENTLVRPTLHFVWVSPNLVETGGFASVCIDDEFEISVNLATTQTIEKSEIQVLINGKSQPPGPRSQLRKGGGGYNFRETIAMEGVGSVCKIGLQVAENVSELVEIRHEPMKKPNCWLLSIGPKTTLEFSEKDARDFADLFSNQSERAGGSKNTLYNEVFIQKIIGPEATSKAIAEQVEELKNLILSKAMPNDLIVVFISTHGFLYNDDLRLQGSDYQPTKARATSISLKLDLLDVLDELPCKKIFFLDACQSGASTGSKNSVPEDIAGAIRSLNSRRLGTSILTSSSSNEFSYEDRAWANGAFTSAIVRGLREAAADANRDQLITLTELSDFVRKEVPEMVKTAKKQPQNPILENPLGAIPIFLVH